MGGRYDTFRIGITHTKTVASSAVHDDERSARADARHLNQEDS
jgi:hypothetical protein